MRKKINVLINSFDFIGLSMSKYLPNYKFEYFFTKSRSKFNFLNDFFEARKKLRNGDWDKYDVIHINNWFNFLLIKYKKPHQIWIAESHAFHLGLHRKKALIDSEWYIRIIGSIFGMICHYPIRKAILKFDYYFVAIPNLELEAKKIRRDAIWFCNPLPENFFVKNIPKIYLEGNPSVYYPTRMHKMKSPEYGFKIFEEILRVYPHAKIHLIKYPDSAAQNSYYQTLLNKYEKFIIWHDLMLPHEMKSKYKSAGIVLGAFGKGLLNLIELEAMSSGGAVVSYDEYEFIKLPKKSLSKFSLKLLSDINFRKDYIKRSQNYVKESHHPKRMAKIYDTLIRKKLL